VRGELDAPEMRSRGKEFDTDPRTLFGGVSEVDDAAFLLFFGDRIDEDHFGAQINVGVDVEQAAMGINDDGLAIFLEFPSSVILAGSANRNPREDAGAAALAGGLGFGHGHKASCYEAGDRVNRPKGQGVQKSRSNFLAEIAQGSVQCGICAARRFRDGTANAGQETAGHKTAAGQEP
jgi:hypothetical protein